MVPHPLSRRRLREWLADLPLVLRRWPTRACHGRRGRAWPARLQVGSVACDGYSDASGGPSASVQVRGRDRSCAAGRQRPSASWGVEDLLACADLRGIETSVAIDGDGRIVAVFQVAPEGCERAGMRSVALLVHPGRRGAGFGRRLRCWPRWRRPCYAGTALLAVIDCENTASLRCFAACGFTRDDDVRPCGYVGGREGGGGGARGGGAPRGGGGGGGEVCGGGRGKRGGRPPYTPAWRRSTAPARSSSRRCAGST